MITTYRLLDGCLTPKNYKDNWILIITINQDQYAVFRYRNRFCIQEGLQIRPQKDTLLSLINAVIDFKSHHVESLEILDPEQVPLLARIKDSYVDLKARLDRETHVIIEIQVLNIRGFEQQVLILQQKPAEPKLSVDRSMQTFCRWLHIR